MPKFFVEPGALAGREIKLTGETARHMLRVLRLRPGGRIILCDGLCTDYSCIITEARAEENTITLTAESSRPCGTEPPVKITLYQSLPKGEKLDFLIQKCVELGVYRIAPVITARSVPKFGNAGHKTERLRRIAASAAAQSMRGIIPVVSAPVPINEAVRRADEDAHLLAHFFEPSAALPVRRFSIKRALEGKKLSSIGLWVGPEGGFTDDEADMLIAINALPVTLGPRVLRTETAGMAALIHILCAMEA